MSCQIMKFTAIKREHLHTPLSADNFCGVYLKADKQKFRPLRNEFNLAQTSLRKLTMHPEASELDGLIEENSQNWAILAQSLSDVFSTTTRDIELSGWMIAAQIVIDPNLSGAKEVALWLQELVTQHWDSLQPVLPENKIKSDDEGEKNKEINAFKIKAFIQLVGESEDSGLLHAPLLMVPMIGDLDYARYKNEEHKGNLAELRSEYQQQALSERTQVMALIDNLSGLKHSIESIEQKISDICKQALVSPVGFKFIINLINKILNAIEYISGLKVELAPTNENSVPISTVETTSDIETKGDGSHVESINMTTPQTVTNQMSFASLSQMQVSNRDQAFHQLREISDYFRKTEPHSPVAYLLEKAIRWGYMPLPELMEELLPNQQDSIERIFNLTGLDEQGQTVLPKVKKTIYTAPVVTPVPSSAAPAISENIAPSSPASVAVSTPEVKVVPEERKVVKDEKPAPTSIEAESKIKKAPAESTSSGNNSLSW